MEDAAWLRENNICMVIAGVGDKTEDFQYGADVELGCHTLPIQYAGRGDGSTPLRDRSSVVKFGIASKAVSHKLVSNRTPLSQVRLTAISWFLIASQRRRK